MSSEIRKVHNTKRLNKNQTKILDSLIESVVVSEKKEDWESVGLACVRDHDKISKLGQNSEIIEISEGHQLPVYPAAILYHSKKVEDS